MSREANSPGLKNFNRKGAFYAAAALVVAGGLWFAFEGDGAVKRVSSVEELRDYFQIRDYPADALQARNAEVPPLYVAGIPDDWAAELSLDTRKTLFFRALLPLVLRANREIRAERTRLLELRDAVAAGRRISDRERRWLRELARRYGLPSDADSRQNESPLPAGGFAALAARVDIVPPSLALVQGAIESAYASSRFAVDGNALFGQWRFGSGLRPADQRTELGDYRIATFDTPLDSVRAYMRNLNTNPAYRSFRSLRAEARRNGTRFPSGLTLAAGLEAYSEKGLAYVDLLRELIRTNRLSATDSARLRDQPPVRIVPGAI